MDLSVWDFYRATYGPTDDREKACTRIRDMEGGRRPVPPLLMRLTRLMALMYARIGRLPTWVERTEPPDAS